MVFRTNIIHAATILPNGEIMKEKKVKKIRNRAFTQDRPSKVIELRIYEPDKNDPCHPSQRGHNYVFYPFDRYGCCSVCSSEILT